LIKKFVLILISAFAVYCKKEDGDELELKKIVIQRMILLIQIERKIPRLLKSLNQNYVPPITDFMNTDSNKKILEGLMKTKRPEKPPKNPAKRSKKNQEPQTDATIHNATIHQNTEAQCHSVNKIKALDIDEMPRELFRSMDADILFFLNEDFDFAETLEENQEKLGLIEFHFIVSDIIHKSEIAFKPTMKKMSSEATSDPVLLFSGMLYAGNSLGKMMKSSKEIDSLIKNKIRQSLDDASEDCLCTDYVQSLKNCLNAFLKLISIILSWKNIALQKHRKLLESILRCFVDRASANMPFNELCDKVIKSFLKFEPNILDVKSGVYLILIVDSVSKFKSLSESPPDLAEDKERLQEMSERFLQKKWDESNSIVSPCFEIFLKYFVSQADLGKVMEYINELRLDANDGMKKKTDYSGVYPSINRLNVVLMFRAYFSKLNYLIQEKGQTMNLREWEYAVELLDTMMEISSLIGINNIYSAFMKYSQIFIKLFMQFGLPVVEQAIAQHTKRVVQLLANLRKTTKFLQTMVTESKKIKNSVIVAQIPAVRSILQSLLYKVQFS
jgi:Fanconi anemia group D2 protein